LTDKSADEFPTEGVEEIVVIVPDNTKVLNIISTIGRVTENKESLLEFTYSGDVEDYIEKYNIISEDDEEVDSEFAIFDSLHEGIKVKSPGGEIIKIKVFLNNRSHVDPSVLELWKQVTLDLKDRHKKYSTNAITEKDKLRATDNIDLSQLKIGLHKHRGIEFEGAKICYYIKKSKSLLVGDKMANRYGAKGIVTKIIPNEFSPYSEYTGKIDIFLSPTGVLGRKNLAVMKEIYLGKVFYNLPKIIQVKLEDPSITTKEIKDLIITIYGLLDASKDGKYLRSIREKLSGYTDIQIRSGLKDKSIKLNYIIEPFTNLPMKKVKEAAKVLDIPLDEYVYIPELETWTKKKVPVGIQYMSCLEQLSTDYESLRSTGSYVSLTGQPKKGKANQGGQSVGNLDIYNLLTYDVPSILEELMTVRSDDFSSKREVITNIIQTGESDLPKSTGDANTKNLYDVHMIAMGLDVK